MCYPMSLRYITMAFEMKILKERYIWVFPLSQKKIYIKSYSLNQTHLRVSDINSN